MLPVDEWVPREWNHGVRPAVCRQFLDAEHGGRVRRRCTMVVKLKPTGPGNSSRGTPRRRLARAAEPRRRAPAGFALPWPRCAEHVPVDLDARPRLDQPEQGPAASDLDVVGVGAEAQDRPRASSVNPGISYGQSVAPSAATSSGRGV